MRSTLHRSFLTAVTVLVLLGWSATPAAAGNHRGPVGDGHQGSNGAVDIRASDGYYPTGGGNVGGCTEDTSSNVIVADDFSQPVVAGMIRGVIGGSYVFPARVGRPANERLFSETGRWFHYRCGTDLFFLPEGGPAVSIDELVLDAVAFLDPPDPPLAVTPDHGRHLVQLPTWLAIQPAYWNENRERTVNAGRVEVTATLTPVHVDWDPGNGDDPPPCPNPGTLWRAGMSDAQSNCSYIYEQPSINPPDNTWELSGTIMFEVTHVTNAPGVYGPWVPVERTSTETIEVMEIQAVAAPS